MMRLRMPRILFSLFAVLLMAGQALASFGPAEEGKEFKRLTNPLTVETGKKIEVVEFFWYRCPHCNQLEPALKAWAKKLPADVKLRPVPAAFREDWMPAARIYYSLLEMGALEKLHGKVFDAYHKENINLNDEATLMGWVKKQGLDQEKFQSIYRSFGTQTQVMKGAQAARQAGIDGVPAIIVDGKYYTAISMALSEERLFEVVNQLIERARKERGGKSAARKPAAKPVAAAK